jgi:hypothetical protein
VKPRFHAGFVGYAFLAAAIAFGQANAEEPIKVVTVCDILSDPAGFNGKLIAVLGRYDATDEGSWLSEDGCGRKLETSGAAVHISVWRVPRGSPSQPVPRMPALDQDSLKAKLAQAGKTTKLGKHLRYQCSVSISDGKTSQPECGWPELPDQWAIAYGRVETMGDGRYGFGHLGGSPAQVFAQGALVLIDEDGRVRL